MMTAEEPLVHEANHLLSSDTVHLRLSAVGRPEGLYIRIEHQVGSHTGLTDLAAALEGVQTRMAAEQARILAWAQNLFPGFAASLDTTDRADLCPIFARQGYFGEYGQVFVRASIRLKFQATEEPNLGRQIVRNMCRGRDDHDQLGLATILVAGFPTQHCQIAINSGGSPCDTRFIHRPSSGLQAS